MLICVFIGFHGRTPALPADQSAAGVAADRRRRPQDDRAVYAHRRRVHLEVPLVAAARSLRAALAGSPARLDGRRCRPRYSSPSRRWAGSIPALDIWTIAYVSIAIAFFSASLRHRGRRIRRELLPEAELGLGNSIYVNAYRISSLVPGSLALILADRMPWSSVFVITALFMLPGLVMTLVVDEPQRRPRTPRTLLRGRGPAVPRILQASGLAAGAVDPRVHLFLQVGRQHGHRARHAVLPRPGLHQDRRSAWWPRTRACGRASSGACWAACGWSGSASTAGCGCSASCRWSRSSASRGSRWLGQPDIVVLGVVIAVEALGVGLGTVAFVAFIARATDPALHGNAIRAADQPGRRFRGRSSTPRRAGSWPRPAGSTFSCCARCWRCRGWHYSCV